MGKEEKKDEEHTTEEEAKDEDQAEERRNTQQGRRREKGTKTNTDNGTEVFDHDDPMASLSESRRLCTTRSVIAGHRRNTRDTCMFVREASAGCAQTLN